jgi:hypothetical protein
MHPAAAREGCTLFSFKSFAAIMAFAGVGCPHVQRNVVDEQILVVKDYPSTCRCAFVIVHALRNTV